MRLHLPVVRFQNFAVTDNCHSSSKKLCETLITMCSITTNLISTYFNYCPKNTFNVKLKLPDRAAFKF